MSGRIFEAQQSRRRALRALAFAVFSMTLMVTPVPTLSQAAGFKELRANGAIGERFDGFVEARDNSSAVKNTVNKVNAERRQIYAKRAKEKGTTVDGVGRVYARQIFGSAPAGTFFLTEGGQWKKK